MTKRNFEAFAREIASRVALAGKLPALYIAADIVATVAAQDNPRFDRERFMRACGL